MLFLIYYSYDNMIAYTREGLANGRVLLCNVEMFQGLCRPLWMGRVSVRAVHSVAHAAALHHRRPTAMPVHFLRFWKIFPRICAPIVAPPTTIFKSVLYAGKGFSSPKKRYKPRWSNSLRYRYVSVTQKRKTLCCLTPTCVVRFLPIFAWRQRRSVPSFHFPNGFWVPSIV